MITKEQIIEKLKELQSQGVTVDFYENLKKEFPELGTASLFIVNDQIYFPLYPGWNIYTIQRSIENAIEEVKRINQIREGKGLLNSIGKSLNLNIPGGTEQYKEDFLDNNSKERLGIIEAANVWSPAIEKKPGTIQVPKINSNPIL